MTSRVIAVGVLFFAVSTQRYLYLMRSDPRHPDCWGLPGGKVELDETLLGALERECTEELGLMPQFLRLMPIERFTSADNHFEYNTFFCAIEREFIPQLNSEHIAYAWVASGTYPKPLHQGLFSTINFEAVREKLTTIQNSLI
jgi:ADP-ribose pyrophosphatase YjhB (NUDIX family)